MRTNSSKPSNRRERATGGARTSCSGPTRRRTNGSSCWRRWRKRSGRAGSRRTFTSSSDSTSTAGDFAPLALDGRLRDVSPLGLTNRVSLGVAGHDEDRPEDDHDEDGQKDQVQELRQVARIAQEDGAVEAPGPDDEERSRNGSGDLSVVGRSVQEEETEGEDHGRQAG